MGDNDCHSDVTGINGGQVFEREGAPWAESAPRIAPGSTAP